MCMLLSASDDLDVARALLKRDGRVVITPGVDAAHFDTTHRVFDFPCATIFTFKILEGENVGWAAVFAFDLLREFKGCWDGAQTASRFLVDIIRPDLRGDSDFSQGCLWVAELVDGLCGDAGKEARRQMYDAYHAPIGQWSSDASRHAMETWEKLVNGPQFASVAETYAVASLLEIFRRSPAEFRIYATQTVAHDRYDYHGCLGPVWVRVVSRTDQPHRLCYSWRLHVVGHRFPGDEDIARAFPQHLLSRLRKERKITPEDRAQIAAWKKRAWSDLTGMSPDEHAIATLVNPRDKERRLEFVVGKVTSSGLAATTIDVDYATINAVKSFNGTVTVVFRQTLKFSAEREVTIILGCKDAEVASRIVTAVSHRRLSRVGRCKEIGTVSVYFGNPADNAIHAGFSADKVDGLRMAFAKKSGSDQMHVERSRGAIFIDAQR